MSSLCICCEGLFTQAYILWLCLISTCHKLKFEWGASANILSQLPWLTWKINPTSGQHLLIEVRLYMVSHKKGVIFCSPGLFSCWEVVFLCCFYYCNSITDSRETAAPSFQLLYRKLPGLCCLIGTTEAPSLMDWITTSCWFPVNDRYSGLAPTVEAPSFKD